MPTGRNGDWRVNVRDGDIFGPVSHTVWCKSERDAEKVERGIRINMNLDCYETEVADSGDYHEEPQ